MQVIQSQRGAGKTTQKTTEIVRGVCIKAVNTSENKGKGCVNKKGVVLGSSRDRVTFVTYEGEYIVVFKWSCVVFDQEQLNMWFDENVVNKGEYDFLTFPEGALRVWDDDDKFVASLEDDE